MKNKISEYSKKDKLGVIAVIALGVIAFALVYFSFNDKDSDNQPVSPWVSDTVISTAADVTTAPSPTFTTTAPHSSAVASTTAAETSGIPQTSATQPTSTTAPSTTVPTTKPEPTKADILKKVTDGINAIKAADASYVGTKTQDIVIDVTDCSYPAFLSIINGVIGLIANKEVLEYDFTNGKCIDPEENVEVTANDTIPPVGTLFALTIDGVKEARYEKIGENTKYTVVLVPETGTYQNPKPIHHGVACDTLDFSLFEIPMGEITKSDFNYPGAIITVTYDNNGKVVGYSEHIDMNGVGEGQAFGITATADMEGYIDESWEIVWK